MKSFNAMMQTMHMTNLLKCLTVNLVRVFLCILLTLNKKKMKWYDSELKEVYRKKQLLYKKFLRKPNASNENRYNEIRML